MREIIEVIKEKPFQSKILDMYLGGLKVAVADIETTGLSSVKNKVILGGVVFLEKDEKRIVQVFADQKEQEPLLLARYAELLAECDVVITYNGHGFDIPFLKKRFEYHGIQTGNLFDRLYHVDLLKIIRRYSNLKDVLPDLKQKTIEEYMGESQNRTDEISGADSVKLYNYYLKLTADAPASGLDGSPSLSPRAQEILSKILLHNRDDIVRLSNLIRIVRQFDLHKIMFCEGWPGVRRILFETDALITEGSAPIRIPIENISGYAVADLVQIGRDTPALAKLPGYESGYLILTGKDRINYLETNALIKSMQEAENI